MSPHGPAITVVSINALRNKIDRHAAVPLIHTVRGVGDMLTDTRV